MNKIILLAGFLSTLTHWGCENTFRLHDTLPINDTVGIAHFETKYNHQEHISLRMDSVLTDSRCPSNVQCVWAGNAGVRFLFTRSGHQVDFILNTHGGPQFNSDTTVHGYEIKLLKLSPYPEDPGGIPQVEYHADIILSAIR